MSRDRSTTEADAGRYAATHAHAADRLESPVRRQRWTIIEDDGSARVLARCECGTERVVRRYRLIAGTSTSCGCSQTIPPLDRMLSSLTFSESGCWEWTKARDKKGYGRLGLGHTRKALAHRWVYEQLVEPIPEGLHIDHLCRNPPCVNPDHLEPVTPAENNRRGNSLTAQQARQAECIRGHAFTPENTAITPAGHRRCRACNAEHARRYRRERAS